MTKIITPNVVAAVKSQFGCQAPTNPGGGHLSIACISQFSICFEPELEDGGGAGTAGSHWEARIFNSEFMTGVSKPHAVVSDVSGSPNHQIVDGVVLLSHARAKKNAMRVAVKAVSYVSNLGLGFAGSV